MNMEENGFGGEWFLFEQIRKIHPMLLHGYPALTAKKYGLEMVAVFRNKDIFLLYEKGKYEEVAGQVHAKFLETSEYYDSVLKENIKGADALFNISKKVFETDFSRLNNKELIGLFKEYINIQCVSHETGFVPNQLEIGHDYISKKAKEIIDKAVKEKNLSIDPNVTFNKLSILDNETFLQKEEKSLDSLLMKILKNQELKKVFEGEEKELIKCIENFPEFCSLLKTHHENFCWLPFMYEGPEWKIDYFASMLASSIRQEITEKEIIAKRKEHETELLEKKELLENLSLSEKDLHYVNFVPRTIFTKSYRKDSMYYACYTIQKMYKEIAKRMAITLDQFRYFLPDEVEPAFIESDFDANELNARIKFSVIAYRKEGVKVFTKNGAKEIFEKIFPKEDVFDKKELQGTPSYPGIVEGKVKIVNHPNEMLLMEEDDIMVSHTTNPNLVPAMRKSSAIVTDIGGLTCHASIVSRELKKPCVVGTKNATRVLCDGDTVKVDAEKGVVTILKKVSK